MAVKVFAAIVIGSSETELCIYEYTSRKIMRQIDRISTRLSLGVDAYSFGRLDPGKVEQLCQVLKDFKRTMNMYKTDGYRLCATSALREIPSADITRDYIEKQTGLHIDIITNSEHRFLDYKSMASVGEMFGEIIRSGTAIVDIGGNSMQVSFFDKDKLVTTQNLPLGRINTGEIYRPCARNNQHFDALVRSLINHEMAGFSKLYQKEKPTKNLIVMDQDLLDAIRSLCRRGDLQQIEEKGRVYALPAEQFSLLYRQALDMSADELSERFELSADAANLVLQSLIFCACLLENTGAQMLWVPDVSLCDGMAYDFGIEKKLLRQDHNFEEDIVAAARNIAKRYKSGSSHIRHVEYLCCEMFDRTRRIHGLSPRERLLLQICAILHNCGKYISLTNVSDCAYNIIMATEIIGLSHRERRIIANVVRYNNQSFQYYNELEDTGVSRQDYLIIAKLTALLRIANALDRSHEQKFSHTQVTMKPGKLIFTVDSASDVTLEKIALAHQREFFADVFNLEPVIVQKKLA